MGAFTAVDPVDTVNNGDDATPLNFQVVVTAAC